VNDNVIQPDNGKQVKTNRNLAVWIGVLGLGSFGLFSVLFIAVMIFHPGLMFKVMPFPSITDKVISDGNKAYLVSQEIDMSTIDTLHNSQPKFKYFISALAGTELGTSQEIPPYEHASGGNHYLLFLNTGVYRIYDGSRWVEESSEAIGKDPKGVLTPAGLYVLSKNKTGQHLNLIASGKSSEIPLPGDYLAAKKNDQCVCATLALYQGRLCLFWTENDSVLWSILNGDTWLPQASSPYSGGYRVVSDDRNLYLFLHEEDGAERHLSYYVYTNDAWKGPVQLSVKGEFMNWDVFVQQGKLRLFIEKFPTQTFYTIEKGALVDPIRLKSQFGPFGMEGLSRMAIMVALSNALTFLIVFGVSAVIRKFKKRIWIEHGTEYEFASLFRRFLAMILDYLVLLVLPTIVIALTLHRIEDIAENPGMFALAMFAVLAFFFVGGFLYFSFLEGLYGQTLGKKICGIRVLKADFSPCGLSAGFLRNIVGIVDAFFYHLVAVVTLAATTKWQRLGDLAAGTVVVKVRR
jgi:uncharacterized RDD family membrane protein YckC